jgi:hypothetical protein
MNNLQDTVLWNHLLEIAVARKTGLIVQPQSGALDSFVVHHGCSVPFDMIYRDAVEPRSFPARTRLRGVGG